MSLLGKIQSAFTDVIAPLVELVVKEIFKGVIFPKLKSSNPEAYQVVLTSLYSPIDVYLEAAVQRTETPIDDAVVSGLMTAIEDAAAADGIVLPNLDED